MVSEFSVLRTGLSVILTGSVRIEERELKADRGLVHTIPISGKVLFRIRVR